MYRSDAALRQAAASVGTLVGPAHAYADIYLRINSKVLLQEFTAGILMYRDVEGVAVADVPPRWEHAALAGGVGARWPGERVD